MLFSNPKLVKISKKALSLVGIGSVVVVVGLLLAIILYPGGFDFLNYFLSDLGHQLANNGDPNDISSILFTLSMILGGFFTLVYWLFSPIIIFNKYTTKLKYFVIAGGIAGIGSSFFLALIGVFPSDSNPSMHELVGIGFFVLASLALLGYSIFFIIDFLDDIQGMKRIAYMILSILVPVFLGGILYVLIEEISILYIIILMAGILVISFLMIYLFPDFSDYLTYILSFVSLAMITTASIIVTLLALANSLSNFPPILEGIYVLVMVSFTISANYNIWELE